MEILYVKVVDRKIKIYTTTGVLDGSVMLQLERLLSGHGFEKVDQGKFVNMNEVTKLCPKENRVFFKNGRSCYVTRINRKKVSSRFDKL